MILRSEITRLAREQGVPPSTIDKDWVLGHFIAGIFRQEWAKSWYTPSCWFPPLIYFGG